MKLNRYQKTAITTVFATLFLIFVGGLVRAAGAGLGCPDWPKCFGMWIPPLDAADLPSGYDAADFNVFKTWTEYINRLVGVVIGFLITATFILSFRYRKTEPRVFFSSAAAFLLVLFQGWLGGRVVLTGLDEWLITLHMGLAVVILNVLLFAAYTATIDRLRIKISSDSKKLLLWMTVFLLVITFIQLVLGTQVREVIDTIKNVPNAPPREQWLDEVGLVDEIHRSFSWLVLAAGVAVFYLSNWRFKTRIIRRLGIWILVLILLQAGLGAGLYYLGMPPAFQVFHLVGSVVVVCLEFLLILLISNAAVGRVDKCR